MGNKVWAWFCRVYPLPSCTNHYCLNVGTLLGTRQNVFEHLRVFGGGKSCTLCNCHNLFTSRKITLKVFTLYITKGLKCFRHITESCKVVKVCLEHNTKQYVSVISNLKLLSGLDVGMRHWVHDWRSPESESTCKQVKQRHLNVTYK